MSCFLKDFSNIYKESQFHTGFMLIKDLTLLSLGLAIFSSPTVDDLTVSHNLVQREERLLATLNAVDSI